MLMIIFFKVEIFPRRAFIRARDSKSGILGKRKWVSGKAGMSGLVIALYGTSLLF
jgi:hypothetical protein